ncbi:LPXTG cell wall anchor domain-containing protein [Streptomyces krungchingensis]|uniref:LPXTG cell wall anchor domain-containing protein n=1 Tax=Streptomyces krungchingensis TaxID=1565034 RepID=UPI003CE91C7F
MRQHIRTSHLRVSAACVAAAAIAAVAPAVAASPAHAEEGEPSLVISSLPRTSPKPGEVYDKSVVITNKGTAAADGVTFRVRLTRGLDFPEEVEGCTYSTVQDQVRQALCELDTVIEPGASIETPVRFKALPNALMEAVQYGTSATGEEPGEGFGDSHRRLTLTADSSADLVAIGEDTEALAGNSQSITVRLRNDGPGWIQNQESDDQTALMVRIPKDTVATEVPKECAPFGIDGPTDPGGTPGKSTYVCWPADYTMDVGEELLFTFMLSIDDDARTTTGWVKATSAYDIHPFFDKNPANDKDTIRVAIPTDNEEDPATAGGSSTVGGSTDGGSTTGGGNHHEGQSTGGSGGGGTGSTGSTSTGTSTVGGSTTGSVDGNLASTGSDGSPLIAAAAAATAALGGGLVLAVRRRRATAKSS